MKEIKVKIIGENASEIWLQSELSTIAPEDIIKIEVVVVNNSVWVYVFYQKEV